MAQVRPQLLFTSALLCYALPDAMADADGASKGSPGLRWGQGSYQGLTHKLATLFVMTAGGANATQFPMMVIAYGGLPFLLACFAFLLFVAFPAMRLESNLAQFVGDGNRGIFSTVPLFFASDNMSTSQMRCLRVSPPMLLYVLTQQMKSLESSLSAFVGIGYAVTAYVVSHVVADTLALADALALLLSLTRSFDWHHDCPGGWMTRNFSCYAIRPGSTPCKLARDELTGTFRQDTSTEGIPVASGSKVLLIPSKHYKDEAAGCIPDLPDTAAPYHFRRQAIWEPGAYDSFRAEPVFAVAIVWLLVFAIAHKGFLKLKMFFYAIVLLHVVTTLMLLGRASTLNGATRGLRLFLHANWSSVTSLEMWSNALYVSLESVGVTGTIYLGIERFNCFKNRFQEDVKFVLVADTATKGIGTVVSFLFLGHLSYATGINIHMLVHADFNFIVSIPHQAVSLVPFPEFWSRIHSLWLVSMMLPKFLIVPDIIIEVLSVSHPPMIVNRRSTHFSICFVMFCLSIPVVIPGGAKGVAILSNNQNNFRLLLLAFEFIVILQLYGVRRLEIDSQLMTGGVPGYFVKLCWTSVIPLALLVLLSAKALRPLILDRQHPLFLTALIAWVQTVEFSFIPVYAIVFIFWTKLCLRDCLVPLPTWVPVSWEQAMQYRQRLAAQGLDMRSLQPLAVVQRAAQNVAPPPSPQDHVTQSSSDLLGTHLILTTEAQISPSTSDWRYDSSEENKGEPPVKFRSPPEKLVPESGTFYKSRPLSSLLRLVRSPKTTGDAVSPPSQRMKDMCQTCKIRSVSNRSAGAAVKPVVAPVAGVSQAAPREKFAPLPRDESGHVTPRGSPGAVPPPATTIPDSAVPCDSEQNRIERPIGVVVNKDLAGTINREPSPAVVMPSTQNQEQVAAKQETTAAELHKSLGTEPAILSRLGRLLADDILANLEGNELHLGAHEARDAAPRSPASPQLSDARPIRVLRTGNEKTEGPTAVVQPAATNAAKSEEGQRRVQEHPVPAESPKRAKKGKVSTTPKKQGSGSPRKSERGRTKASTPRETGGDKHVKSPEPTASPAPLHQPVKPPHHKKHHGSPSRKTKALSSAPSPAKMLKSPRRALDVKTPPAIGPSFAIAKVAHTQKATVSREKTAEEADAPSLAAIASPSPTRRKSADKTKNSDRALVSGKNQAADSGAPTPAREAVSPSRKSAPSPSRKASHHRKHFDGVVAAASPKVLEKKQPSKKLAVHLPPSGQMQSPRMSPASHAENAHHVALSSPLPKAKTTDAALKVTATKNRQPAAGKAAARDSSALLALPPNPYGLYISTSQPTGYRLSPLSSDCEEPDRASDKRHKLPPPGTGHPFPRHERKNTPAVRTRSPGLAIQSGRRDAATQKTPASLRADTARAGASAQLPEAPSTDVLRNQAPPQVPVSGVTAAANSEGQAEGPEAGEIKVEQGQDSLPKKDDSA